MWTTGVFSTLKAPCEGTRTTCRVPLSLVLAVAVSLVGCATPRPAPPLMCTLRAITPEQPPQPAPPTPTPALLHPGVTPTPAEPTVRAAVPPELRTLRGQIKASFEQRRDRKRALRPPVTPPVDPSRPSPLPAPAPPPTYDILVLSAGGQFGAYGSGFLAGWGARTDLAPNRGDIDMVTGVSTGAMMATYAYLGASVDPAVRATYDALLKEEYTTLRNENVFRKRQPFELLWANSIYDTAPLRARIDQAITDALLQAVVAEHERSQRLLFVGAVNADSGRFEHFDLVTIARSPQPERLQCYRAAVLASAAIPAAFTPVFINNQMYVDGGARRHAFFLQQVEEALPGVGTNVFGILHGNLTIPPADTGNNLIGVVSRTVSIGTDQLMLESAYYVDAEARRLGYRPKWTAATDTGCDAQGSDDMFDPRLGTCLWDAGYAKATRDPNPWKDLSEIGIRSQD
jgi:Patatin-like phospholipase